MGASPGYRGLKVFKKVNLISKEETARMKDFASVLRYERSIRGWTQADVAEKVGSDSRTVRRWEHGKTVPTPYLRQRICQIFGKTATELGLLHESLPSPHTEEVAQESLINSTLAPIPLQDVSDYPPQQSPFLPEFPQQKEVKFDPLQLRVKRSSGWLSYLINAVLLVYSVIFVILSFYSSNQPKTVPQQVIRNLPIACGDCDQPEITLILASTTVDLTKGFVVMDLRFINKTPRDAGFLFSAASLNDPAGNTYYTQPMPVFVTAGQTKVVGVSFSLVPRAGTPYTLFIVITRPDKWTDFYRPISLPF